MSDQSEKSAIYNILAFAFEGQHTANKIVKEIKLLKEIKGRAALKRKYVFPEAAKLYAAYPNAPGSALVELIQDHIEKKAEIPTATTVPGMA